MKTILYVDEVESELLSFKVKFESLDAFTVDYLRVIDGLDIDDLLQDIHSRRFDCLLIDYFLRQQAKVSYQGDEVASRFSERHPEYPLLMLSNKDDDAIQAASGFDVTKIRSKNFYQKETDKFIAMINKMVDDYQDTQSKDEEELRNLRVREIQGELNAREEERLAELDTLVDNRLDSSNKIPKDIKKTSNTQKLDELLKRADQIIDKLTDA